MKLRWIVLTGLIVSGLIVGAAVRDRPPQRSEFCVADVGKVQARIDLEQSRWSTLMSAIGLRRGLPPRATTIAIATAFQESKIHNIDYGDRDSVGLFQQRTSQGWGTVEQILDPHYSIGAFYDALAKVDGYENMEITVAAQLVQRSAFPGAYAAHEDYARALASSLRGYSPAAFWCQFNPTGSGSATKVAENVDVAFGKQVHTADGDDLTYPLSGPADDVKARGWALAHYLVGNAQQMGISEVSFNRHTWSADTSDQGWVQDPDVDRSRVIVTTR